MNATELRIGNLVWEDYSGTMEVVEINKLGDIGLVKPYMKAIGLYDAKHLNGIPITTEWLQRLGFYDRSGEQANGLGFGININEAVELCWYVIKGYEEEGIKLQTIGSGWTMNVKVEYVHQVQNLYFSLTGKELTICQP